MQSNTRTVQNEWLVAVCTERNGERAQSRAREGTRYQTKMALQGHIHCTFVITWQTLATKFRQKLLINYLKFRFTRTKIARVTEPFRNTTKLVEYCRKNTKFFDFPAPKDLIFMTAAEAFSSAIAC